jgi:hypothetical protein
MEVNWQKRWKLLAVKWRKTKLLFSTNKKVKGTNLSMKNLRGNLASLKWDFFNMNEQNEVSWMGFDNSNVNLTTIELNVKFFVVFPWKFLSFEEKS